MASVNVTDIKVLNNPAKFSDPFEFEIQFECVKPLSADLEWKLTYVGSAESEECDQEIDSVLVGPVPLGVNCFVFETDCPDIKKIPKRDILGVTVLLISCLYKGKEFIRIGYYVNNEYTDPTMIMPAENLEDEADAMDIGESEEEEEEEDGDDDAEDDDEDEDLDTEGNRLQEERKENVLPSENTNMSDEQPSDLPPTPVKALNALNIAENSTGGGNVPPQAATFQLPSDFSIDKIKRHILDDSPRVTRFLIDWDDN